MFSILYGRPGQGAAFAFRFGKIPDKSFRKSELPSICSEELARITGIKIPEKDVRLFWDVQPHMRCENYPDIRDYFLDNGVLACTYKPRTRIPGACWRIYMPRASHEVSSVFHRIKLFSDGFLTVRERLTRWGMVMQIAERIKELQDSYLDRPKEWSHILNVLDVRKADLRATFEFTNQMHLLNPVHDAIPIKVLEVATVFRIMFKLSLQQFELACNNP
jgi:hypothetical protein